MHEDLHLVSLHFLLPCGVCTLEACLHITGSHFGQDTQLIYVEVRQL